MSETTRQYIFTLFFNYANGERVRAEKRREESLVYLKGLFENRAKFSCIARDERDESKIARDGGRASACLMLRGYCNLNSPCKHEYAKRLFGKYSSLKPSYFGDMVNLCRFIHVDRNLTVTGRLPHGRKDSVAKLHSFTGDPKFVIKILLDSIDKKDFEQIKTENKEENGL